MKLNVKGLVFVGFAAAVFASAAQAETGDNRKVTSLAYTDATYQAKTTANNANKVLYMQSNTAGDIGYKAISNNSSDIVNDNQKAGVLVDAQAIAQKIAASESATTYTGTAPVSINAQNQISVAGMTGADGTVAGATGLVPAPAATDNVKVLSGAGTWVTNNDTTVATGDANGKIAVTHNGTTTQVPVYGLGSAAYTDSTAYATAAQGEKADSAVQSVIAGDSGVGTIKVDGSTVTAYGLGSAAGVDTTTDNTLAVTGETGKLPTAATVKAYVDAKATTDLSGKQDKTGANSGIVVGYDNGAWKTLEGANDSSVTYDSTSQKVKVSTTIPVKGVQVNGTDLSPDGTTKKVNLTVTTGDSTTGVGSIKVNGAGVTVYGLGTAAAAATTTSVADGGTGLPTAGAVYSAIQAVANGVELPTIDTSVCNSTTPCALVLAGDQPTWEPIQQAQ